MRSDCARDERMHREPVMRIVIATRSGASRDQRSYRRGQFLLSSTVNFNTDSEEKDHGNTRQKVSREVRRKEQG